MESVHPDSALRCRRRDDEPGGVLVRNRDLAQPRRGYDALAAIDLTGADDETKYYVTRELRDFRLAGVDKDEATRSSIRELRDLLVIIGQDFDRNIRENVRTIQVKPAELAGLPQDFIDAHKPDASGLVTLNINYPDYIPTMTYCKSDATSGGACSSSTTTARYPKNVDVLKDMLAKRYELAKLCGYPDWADYITANKMSGSAKTVREFIDRIVAASGPGPGCATSARCSPARRRTSRPRPPSTRGRTPTGRSMVKRSDYGFDAQSLRPYLAVRPGPARASSTSRARCSA